MFCGRNRNVGDRRSVSALRRARYFQTPRPICFLVRQERFGELIEKSRNPMIRFVEFGERCSLDDFLSALIDELTAICCQEFGATQWPPKWLSFAPLGGRSRSLPWRVN